jgi:hypothetical protein
MTRGQAVFDDVAGLRPGGPVGRPALSSAGWRRLIDRSDALTLADALAEEIKSSELPMWLSRTAATAGRDPPVTVERGQRSLAAVVNAHLIRRPATLGNLDCYST